jgi:hypothetical protein
MRSNSASTYNATSPRAALVASQCGAAFGAEVAHPEATMARGSTPKRIKNSRSPGAIRLVLPQLHRSLITSPSVERRASAASDSHCQRLGFQVSR